MEILKLIRPSYYSIDRHKVPYKRTAHIDLLIIVKKLVQYVCVFKRFEGGLFLAFHAFMSVFKCKYQEY